MSGLVAYEASDNEDSDRSASSSPHTQNDEGLVSYALDASGNAALERTQTTTSGDSQGGTSSPKFPAAPGRAILHSKVSLLRGSIVTARTTSSPTTESTTTTMLKSPRIQSSSSFLAASSPSFSPQLASAPTPPPMIASSSSNSNATYSANLSLLPPTPTGPYPPGVAEKVAKLIATTRSTGQSVNKHIASRKQFNNPCIYQHLIEHTGMKEETGSNYPPAVYNPKAWRPRDYYLELIEEQKAFDEKRARAKATRTEIAFASSAATADVKRGKWDQLPPANAPASAAASAAKARVSAMAKQISTRL